MHANDDKTTTPQTPLSKLERISALPGGIARLTRRLGPVHPFPTTLVLGGNTVEVRGAPELILLLDLHRPADGEQRLRHFHDVVCQIMLAQGEERCVISTNLISSRHAPSVEATLMPGWTRPAWLNLADADDVICSLPVMEHVKRKFRGSIEEFIHRWVTDFSLKSIAQMRDEEVTAALRSRDAALYRRLIDYLDHLPGASVDTISSHIRTALVAPADIEALLAAQPQRAARKAEGAFERTQELRSERLKRA